jgi:Kef-type K+ transport system membrane component KefB
MAVEFSGLRMSDLLLLLVICGAAMLGKLAAGSLTARAARVPWRDSLVIGVLLNTRGLTELIVLNVGLQAGVIGPRLYALLVVMALLTTAVSGPLLQLLRRPVGPVSATGPTGPDKAPEPCPGPDTGQSPAGDAEPAPRT